MTLNEKIKSLEQQVNELNGKIDNLVKESGKKDQPPRTTLGGSRILNISYPIDASSGRGAISGGAVIWNDTEIDAPYGTQPDVPTIGYNKHAHSRFSGGALIKDVIEIVEYDWAAITNKHSQGFLKSNNAPKIKKEENTKKQQVDKIGLLDLVFNPDTCTWGCPAYEIDIKKCYLVERDEDGIIAVDSKGQQKRSPLYNEDQTKTSIIWDEDGNCFRFFAVYATGDPDV